MGTTTIRIAVVSAMLAMAATAPSAHAVEVNIVRDGPVNITVKADDQGEGGPRVNFTDRGGVPTVNVEKELAKIGPEVKIKPAGTIQSELLDDIARQHPVASNGMPIVRGNWGASGPLAIGSSVGKPSFVKVMENGGIALLIQDDKGNPVVNIPPDSFLVADLESGRLRQFSLEPVSLAFSLLIDNSGSMDSVVSKVREESTAFLRGMGAKALCQVSKFDTGREVLTKKPSACNAKETVDLIRKIDGSGNSTNMVSAIEAELDSLAKVQADFRALVIITDGDETGGGNAASIMAKKKTPIFSYWIGDSKKDTILRPISDAFFPDLNKGSDVLERMLKKVASSHQGITVIRVP